MKNKLPGNCICLFLVLSTLMLLACGDDAETIQPLSAPENPVLSAKTLSSLSFTWSAVENATGYVCKLLDETGAVAEKESNTTSVTYAGLIENKTYRFAVMAYRNTKEDASVYTSYLPATTDARLITPINIALEAKTENSLTFKWDAVTGAAGYNCKLTTGTPEVAIDLQAEIASITFTGLTANTTYNFQVQAYSTNPEKNSEYSTKLEEKTEETPGPVDPIMDFGFPSWENDGLVRAFPGAEGGGMLTTGGRGGKVYKVTNLNDSGTGSLRAAINASGPRIVIFEVDGIIELKSKLQINNNDITIAGQTAPGDGICLKNYPLIVNADNVIIRFIRCRMGDQVNAEADAMEGRFHKNIIIDHCSMSWSTDECSSFYANQNFTMQWCILAESLRNSAHAKGTHGYGAIWGGVNASYHHNLLAHHESRNPRFDGGDVYDGYNSGNSLRNDQRVVDFRNCVVYNFSNFTAYGGEGQKVNFVGNYYKWGPGSENGPGKSYKNNIESPNSPKKRQWFYYVQGVKEANKIPVDFGCPHIYFGNNTNYFTPDKNNLNVNNWNGVVYDNNNKGATEYTVLNTPLAIQTKENGQHAKVTTHSATVAYERVLEFAGVQWTRDNTNTRDAVDARAVKDTRTGTATCMAASRGSINGYVDSPSDVGGWPTYKKGTAPKDSDGDGIPDEWEEATGLNKNSSTDGNAKTLDPTGRYTNLEVYLHWLVKDVVLGQHEGGDYITQN